MFINFCRMIFWGHCTTHVYRKSKLFSFFFLWLFSLGSKIHWTHTWGHSEGTYTGKPNIIPDQFFNHKTHDPWNCPGHWSMNHCHMASRKQSLVSCSYYIYTYILQEKKLSGSTGVFFDNIGTRLSINRTVVRTETCSLIPVLLSTLQRCHAK